MPVFGTNSKQRLSTCHPDIQRLFNEVIKEFDCLIAEGHRSAEKQAELWASGRTKPGPILTKVRTSKHNTLPSLAVDVVPYPSLWRSEQKFYELAAVVQRKAKELGVDIRWGGDWDRDGRSDDEKWLDLPHWELVSK